MAKVYSVKKARKPQGPCEKCKTEIKKGDPYIYWAFAQGGGFGAPHKRCTNPACHPKPSELTQSEFWGALFALQEQGFSGETIEDLESERDEMVSDLLNIQSETEDKLNNMPEGLQQGDSGQLLQERIDTLESAGSELEGVDISFDPDEDLDDEKKEEALKNRVQEIKDELDDILGGISCS